MIKKAFGLRVKYKGITIEDRNSFFCVQDMALVQLEINQL